MNRRCGRQGHALRLFVLIFSRLLLIRPLCLLTLKYFLLRRRRCYAIAVMKTLLAMGPTSMHVDLVTAFTFHVSTASPHGGAAYAAWTLKDLIDPMLGASLCFYAGRCGSLSSSFSASALPMLAERHINSFSSVTG